MLRNNALSPTAIVIHFYYLLKRNPRRIFLRVPFLRKPPVPSKHLDSPFPCNNLDIAHKTNFNRWPFKRIFWRRPPSPLAKLDEKRDKLLVQDWWWGRIRGQGRNAGGEGFRRI